MISLPIGVGLFGFILFYVLGATRLETFLNMHSLVLVAGGTFAALFMATPLKQIKALGQGLLLILTAESGPEKWAADLAKVSRNREVTLRATHPLILCAQELWRNGVDDNVFLTRLRQSADLIAEHKEGASSVLRNIAKYPPALGMTGTVIGMVQMFSNLTADARNSIGPNIAIAMTATFYGLTLSNVIIMPLADRLTIHKTKELACVETLFKSLLIIHSGELILEKNEVVTYANAS